MLRMLKARLKTAESYKLETNTTHNPEAQADEKERQISRKCLGLPTVLREILRHLSTAELIEFSLVNKLWNFEARSVMKERGNLVASTWSHEDDPCQKLVAFASDLKNMRVIPFFGINLHMHHRFVWQPFLNQPLDSSYKLILNRVPLKYFAVRFRDDWEQCKECPSLMLLKKILEDFCVVLEELSLERGKEEFYRSILQDRSLRCLKTLKIKPGDFSRTHEPLTSAFIKMLVSRAPNLQELHIDGKINFQENILEGSSAVLVPTHTFRPLFDQVSEDLISSLRAHTMDLRIKSKEMDADLLSRFVPMVLQASRSTLKTLSLDLHSFMLLMSFGICLENVTTLHFHTNRVAHCNIEQFILEIPPSLTFDRVFPRLNQGTIVNDFGDHCYVLWRQVPAHPLILK